MTRLVGGLFGRAVVEDPAPAGLTRMTREEWGDQFPAVLELADSTVDGDGREEAALRRALLKQTQLEELPLGLAFDASRDGWSGAAFHARLDGQGAALVVCETEGGALCGGYNPRGFLGYGDWSDAISAFLFSWPDGDVENVEARVKCPKTGGSGMAVLDEAGGLIQFAPDGLKIDVDARRATCRLGTYYERTPDGGKSLFAPEEKTRSGGAADLVALRVYVGLGETAKQASYVPNALQWQPGELERIREQDGR